MLKDLSILYIEPDFFVISMSDPSDISDMSDCESVQSDISDMDVSNIHSNKLMKGGASFSIPLDALGTSAVSDEERLAAEAAAKRLEEKEKQAALAQMVQNQDDAEERNHRKELEPINDEFLEYLNSSLFELNFRKKLVEKRDKLIDDKGLDDFIKENIYELIRWYDFIIKKHKSFFGKSGNRKLYSIILCTNINNYLRIGLLCNDVTDDFNMYGDYLDGQNISREDITRNTREFITKAQLQKTLDDFAIEQTRKANQNKEYKSFNNITSDGEALAIGVANFTNYVRNTAATIAVNMAGMFEVEQVNTKYIYDKIEDEEYKRGLAVYIINI